MERNVLGLIEITSIPEGEAPLWVRQAWVGLILPCDSTCGVREVKGVISKKPSDKNKYGFAVPQAAALKVLEKKDPHAVDFWRREGFPKRGEFFFFVDQEAKIVSGVKRQILIHVTDEMQGDPFR